MPNTLLTIGGITRKAIQLFRQSNAFLQMIDRQHDSSFAVTGAKIGSQLRIRLPNDYIVRTGVTAAPQNTVENQVTLTVATQQGVDVSFPSSDLALSLDDFSYRILEPMINDLAGAVAVNVMAGAENIPNLVHNVDGSNNTISPSATTWLFAGAVLDRQLCPRVNRCIVVDPTTLSRTVAGLTGLFNPQADISKQYKTGLIAQNVFGFDWAMDQTVLLHTEGAFTTGTLNGASQSGSTLTVSALGAALKTGDIITIANVHEVNRITKKSTGVLRQFVLTADAAGGATSISVYPPLISQVGGLDVAYQTVDNVPATNAAITTPVNASEVYRKNFAFHPTAVTMVTADLELPSGAVVSAAREAYDGISIRLIRDYITTSDTWLTRTDSLYGWCWPRPEWAVIVADAL